MAGGGRREAEQLVDQARGPARQAARRRGARPDIPPSAADKAAMRDPPQEQGAAEIALGIDDQVETAVEDRVAALPRQAQRRRGLGRNARSVMNSAMRPPTSGASCRAR